ncbi:MAG TPA: hypothetical protein DEA96_06605 [Leptospiraceae bacterium]|nr:hypothetical protein [Spirochaetaceae bacterium]HBS04614.1 hypothetical protein [Leptospiraceae bacterium]
MFLCRMRLSLIRVLLCTLVPISGNCFSGGGPVFRGQEFPLTVCLAESQKAYWYQYALFDSRPIPDFSSDSLLNRFAVFIPGTGLDFGKVASYQSPVYSGLAAIEKDSGFEIPARSGQFLYIVIGRELQEPVWNHTEAELALLVTLSTESGPGPGESVRAMPHRLLYETTLDPDYYKSLQIELRSRNSSEQNLVTEKSGWIPLWNYDVPGNSGLDWNAGGCNTREAPDVQYDF